MPDAPDTLTPPAPVEAALRGVCPRCGKGRMFGGWIAFAKRCSACGLDFSEFNVGDGPVVFLTLGIGALVTVLAVSVELTFEPGWLVHALLWAPLTAALVIGGLRLTKGLLLALEFGHAAREGRIKP